jgi:hypothetical protein
MSKPPQYGKNPRASANLSLLHPNETNPISYQDRYSHLHTNNRHKDLHTKTIGETETITESHTANSLCPLNTPFIKEKAAASANICA